MRVVLMLLASALLLTVAFQYGVRWLLGDAVREMAEQAHTSPATSAAHPQFRP